MKQEAEIEMFAAKEWATMSIPCKATPAIEDPSRLNATVVEETTPEDRTDRTLRLLTEPDSLPEGQPYVGCERSSADPREQILGLYDEYRPRLFRYIRSMSLSQDQAEEVIQETFMRLTTRLLQQDDIDNVQGWIVRVAHNVAVDALKKNDRDGVGSSGIDLTLENLADPTLNPEQEYLKKEQISRMEICLATFNQQQRNCFNMRVQGFRYKDIGLALGISEQRAAFILKQVAVRLAATCG
jgi:RNA polymerase sigma-70 factor, ECF subfamily